MNKVKPKDYWCWYCSYAGNRFRLQKNQGHVHCEHPDPKIAGEPGWGTLRACWDTCKEFKKK